ncbi:hypothetical protein ACFONG_15135 [Uliginosibacterium paludis]|uniref:TIR domain-containing protein n=1 Tax=Uliginosibacterium paludis TaxID=1615952 RepID=A0ABV2CTE6_9RHOO
MSAIAVNDIRGVIREAAKAAEGYFAQTGIHAKLLEDGVPFLSYRKHWEPNHFWDQLPQEVQETANALIAQLLPACAALAEATRTSPLTGSEDVHDVKVATKAIRAALRLRRYSYREPDVIHDEGTVLGFRAAEQFESSGLSPDEAEDEFFSQLSKLNAVLKLVEAAPPASGHESISPGSEAAKYRASTAFIMMWMDPAHPELTDVADAVRTAFRSFGIRAVRADDIEHEGLISERVLNEIRTAEFLFADLTGTRPNVYYEVGFAHALGKRVILFRKAGTGIHFDLAGYNCPEYDNLRDLKEKLSKRLVSLTNRNPNDPTEI